MSREVKIAAAFCAVSALLMGGYETYDALKNPLVGQKSMFSASIISVYGEDNAHIQGCLDKIKKDQGCSATEIKKLVALKTNEKNVNQGLSLMLAGSLGLSFLAVTLGEEKGRADAKKDVENLKKAANQGGMPADDDIPPNPGMTM